MRNPQRKSDQDSSFTISRPSLPVHDGGETSNYKPLRSNESVETLKQAYDKLDTHYPCYTYWLFLMILISGFYFAYICAITLDAFKHYGFVEHFTLLGFIILMGAAFAQYILEIWAIYTRHLDEANLALRFVTFNTVIFLGLNVLTGYNLYQSIQKEFREDLEPSAFSRTVLINGVITASIFSLTQIFITHFLAVKVRNSLAKREAIEFQLRSISTPCNEF